MFVKSVFSAPPRLCANLSTEFISRPLRSRCRSAEFKSTPDVIRSLFGAPHEQEAVDEQQSHCTQNGRDKTGRLALCIPTCLLSDEIREKGATNSKERRDDEAAGVTTRH